MFGHHTGRRDEIVFHSETILTANNILVDIFAAGDIFMGRVFIWRRHFIWVNTYFVGGKFCLGSFL